MRSPASTSIPSTQDLNRTRAGLISKDQSHSGRGAAKMIGIVFIVGLLVFDLVALRRIGNPYG
jgi:hypothetical protein